MGDWVLYGATGYTGELVAEEAVARGQRPLLAGRSAEKLARLAQRLGLAWEAVALDDAAGLRRLLARHKAVLHVAGPFVDTWAPMVDACLDTGCAYLDLDGEIPVLEAIYGRDAEAKARGIALVPAVGYDVVPTEGLAAQVAARVPGATELELVVAALGRPSPGTTRTSLRVLAAGVQVRRDGKLVSRPMGLEARRQRFPWGNPWTVPVGLAELSSVYRSTGIGDLTTRYVVGAAAGRASALAWPVLEAGRRLLAVGLRVPAVLRRADAWVSANVQGPDEALRQRAKTSIWAQARAPDGRSAEAWLETAEAYLFTARVAVRAVERCLAGLPPGAWAPSQVFGAEFALEIAGTRRVEQLDPGRD